MSAEQGTAAALAVAAAGAALLRKRGGKQPEKGGIYITESDRTTLLEKINQIASSRKRAERCEGSEENEAEEEKWLSGCRQYRWYRSKILSSQSRATIREVANSFNGGTYTEKVLTEDTVMYRVSGGNAKEVGSYLSMTPQGGGLQSQLDLALNPAWGNTTENATKVLVPKGTTIYEGIAASQNIYDGLGNVIGTLHGGGNQGYIPTAAARWFQ